MSRRMKVPSRIELLREQYADASSAVREMTTAGSYQALVSGRRQLLQIHEELQQLEASEASEASALVDDDIEAGLIAALRELPHDMTARIIDAVQRPSLRLVGDE